MTVATPEGPVRLLAPAAKVVGETESFGPVPALGEQDETLRKEFGEK